MLLLFNKKTFDSHFFKVILNKFELKLRQIILPLFMASLLFMCTCFEIGRKTAYEILLSNY